MSALTWSHQWRLSVSPETLTEIDNGIECCALDLRELTPSQLDSNGITKP
jgi:hypothetical protein